jgi:outer membrane protein
MKKHSLKALVATLCLGGSAVAAEAPQIGVVNFSTCVMESKSGKKEQESMETLRKQMTSLMEETDKELKEISAKFEDTEFLDSLSPKAEEELKMKFQTLQEDMGRYQNQFYQVLQHAHSQLMQKMHGNIAKAAESLASDHNLDYVLNKEACFYIRPGLDLTNEVISKMDKQFEEVAALEAPQVQNGEPLTDEAAPK